MTQALEVDAVVVGGGPAGLSAALCLARYDRSVVVLDAGSGRSTQHQVNRNYLGFPGGVAARRLRELGLEQLADYPQVEIVRSDADKAVRHDGHQEVSGSFGSATSRCVVLCTGIEDIYPDYVTDPGCLGRSVFWCVSCDGYESRGRKVIVSGDGDETAVEALLIARYTSDVTLVTGSRRQTVPPDLRERLAGAGVELVEEEVRHLEGCDGDVKLLVTGSGRELPLERLFVQQTMRPRTDLAAMLGAELDEDGYLQVDTEQHTSVPGVFAAGDVTHLHSHQISTAVHEGAQAAAAAQHHLYTAEFGL